MVAMAAMSAPKSAAEARHGAQAPEHGQHPDQGTTAAQARRRYLKASGSGLVGAFLGSVTRPGEVRSRDGAPSLVFAAVPDGIREVDEVPPTIRVECFYDVDALALLLTKGTQIYVEGSLRLTTWTGRGGAERTGLSINATHIEVLT